MYFVWQYKLVCLLKYLLVVHETVALLVLIIWTASFELICSSRD